MVARLGAAGTHWIEPLSRSAVPVVAERARRLLASVPLPPRERMRLCLLGKMVLYRGDSAVDDAGWRHAKVRELLAYLAIHPEAPRTDVIADLWPALSEEAGANNLRVTLFALRAVLEPGRPARGPSFVVRSDGYRLRLTRGDHLEVDVCAFEGRLQLARHAESTADELDAYLSALPLRRGPFLSDLYDAGWATAARADLDGQFVAAALRACELLLGRDPARALELAGQVLEVDPASERAFRIKATVYHRQGARAAARQLLAVCRRELRRLGVEPEPETELLERLVGREDA
jgi:DNA-binding SARP family transcriptional activator